MKEFSDYFWKQFNQTINFSDYLNVSVSNSERRKYKIKRLFNI
jgi:hypothetical protein